MELDFVTSLVNFAAALLIVAFGLLKKIREYAFLLIVPAVHFLLHSYNSQKLEP